MAIDLKSPKSMLAIYAFFFALCLFMLLVSSTVVRRSIASKHWPSTTGKIKKSEVSWDINSGKSSSHTYSPALTFNYSVGGKEYESSNYKMYNPSFNSRSDAENIISQYPVDSEVTVYYSRQHPSIAVLKPGLTLRFIGMPILSGIFVIILPVIALLNFKKMKKGESMNETVSLGRTPEDFGRELMKNEEARKYLEEMFRKVNQGKKN